MKKIIIFGFPHCGTTILRAIIGHIDDVEEVLSEQNFLTEEDLIEKTNKKYKLCKFPFLIDFKDKKYDNYIKIFIIRNPLFVFSSLNKRFDFNLNYDHSIEKYIETISEFIYCRNNPIKNLYTIRYEDLFYNNFQNLKNIFNSIGFEYTDKIFNNNEYKNFSHCIGQIVLDNQPPNKDHDNYRNWQINKPFVYSDNISKINLNTEQIDQLINNPQILTVFPLIKLKVEKYLEEKIENKNVENKI